MKSTCLILYLSVLDLNKQPGSDSDPSQYIVECNQQWSCFSFYFLDKVLHWSKKQPWDFDGSPHFEGFQVQKVIFGMSSVSVCGHYNSKNNWVSSTKFGMRSYMIKITAWIAYEQNRPTGLASSLNAQFVFWRKGLKNALTKIFFFRHKLLEIKSCNFCVMLHISISCAILEL